MADYSAESRQRIVDARRLAEHKLRRTLLLLGDVEDGLLCLNAFKEFACVLFDVEADELLTVCGSPEEYQLALDDLLGATIESVAPHHLPSSSYENLPKPESTEQDIETGLLWDADVGDNRQPAGERLLRSCSPRGHWERLAPVGCRFFARLSGHDIVRSVLRQTLAQQRFHWIDRFNTGSAPSATFSATKTAGARRTWRSGPKPDQAHASRISEVVRSVVPTGDWRGKLGLVLQALDEAKIPAPKTWLKEEPPCRDWESQLERQKAIKVIQYWLRLAKE